MQKPIDKIYEIRIKLKTGQITFDEAKILIAPLIKEMEVRAEKVAKEFGKKPPKFSFINLMR